LIHNKHFDRFKNLKTHGVPEPDATIKAVARKKILHYRQLYVDRTDPIAFMPVAVDTSGRIYDDFLRLLFLHTHREASALTNDIRPFSFSSRCTSSQYSGVSGFDFGEGLGHEDFHTT
jgi:hypothetical protein